jgi:hypothetical protein
MEAVGGNPPSTAPTQTQPQERPGIGGAGENSLIPTSGPALVKDQTVDATAGTVKPPSYTQPPPIEEDVAVINRFALMASKKGMDLKTSKEMNDIVKDAKSRHKDNPEAVNAIDQAIELATVGISEEDISSVMRMYGVDRPTAIEITKTQKGIKSTVGKAVKSGVKKGVSAVSKGAEKGIDFLSRSNNNSAF